MVMLSKGILLVNKKLPPRTIQVWPSMIKVKPDPNLSNIYKRNSLEVATTSNQPKKTSLSKNLIMLLSYGGVPDDFFMDILKNAIEESQGVFSNKRSTIKEKREEGKSRTSTNCCFILHFGMILSTLMFRFLASILDKIPCLGRSICS